MTKKIFNTLPQFYGCEPADEVIRRRRTGEACYDKCYGRKATTYVCENYICNRPVNKIDDFDEMLFDIARTK